MEALAAYFTMRNRLGAAEHRITALMGQLTDAGTTFEKLASKASQTDVDP